MTDTSAPLGDAEWLGLISAETRPSEEKVIMVCRNRKTLRVKKDDWGRHFAGYGGIGFKRGPEVEIVPAESGGPNAEVPQWAARQLDCAAANALCVTQKGRKHLLKRLDLVRRPGDIPGCVVTDTFSANAVTRAYSLETELDKVNRALFDRLLSKFGRFRRDPLEAFRRMDGRVGMLARREFFGSFTKEDRAAIRGRRKEITDRRQDNGSWRDSAVCTAFNMIRLLEMGQKAESAPMARAARWLLSAGEPAGLPGMFMVSEKLAVTFSNWKNTPGATGRQYRRHVPAEKKVFQDNTDILPAFSNSFCELRLTWATAVALEALIRCGLADNARVRRAINTLLSLSKRGRFGPGGGWCGCGYLDARVRMPKSDAAVHFNSFPPPRQNVRYRIDWFASPRDVLSLVSGACGGEHDYESHATGAREALWVKKFHTTGDCWCVVHWAMSCHPQYAGSTLEAIGALQCAYRQGADGRWGDANLSSMFGLLERISHPLSAFLALRSLPLLIRRQSPDGLWPEEVIRDSRKNLGFPTREEGAFMILKALNRFAFLSRLRGR